MKLSEKQLNDYHRDGFLVLQDLFAAGEVAVMLQEMERIIQEDCPRRILEKSGAVRSFFAPEAGSGIYARVIRDERVLLPAIQLLNNNVYVHQSKLNTKHAMVGDWWAWHQDFTFWHNDDGMPRPDVLTAMIYLNDTNEFNGPMLIIPGSHRDGIASTGDTDEKEDDANGWFNAYQNSATYMSALTADLKYTLEKDNIKRWAGRKGIVSAKAPAGSVLFFHGNVFHASSNNLSPWDRHAFLITYNSIENQLTDISNPRPEFIASRNYTPLLKNIQL
ncbi:MULTISPECIES: phytanoyl-CoA dioxygenase family protein [Niastella]|uniref:Phytanoyl-CoA dioxygenase family protein n=1 Tax=Niastella soli TaxID=2821487 RepID=A0ABS3YUE6_9BACT|nr:phytanoyl-CoA dioxygenase family protein [Niastella soli]MBO9201556.1 phytanoyl-CoA dioxygenase family protein [Niastella soli]